MNTERKLLGNAIESFSISPMKLNRAIIGAGIMPQRRILLNEDIEAEEIHSEGYINRL